MKTNLGGCLVIVFICFCIGSCALHGCGCIPQPSIYEIKQRQYEYEKKQREDRVRRELIDYSIKDRVERGW